MYLLREGELAITLRGRVSVLALLFIGQCQVFCLS